MKGKTLAIMLGVLYIGFVATACGLSVYDAWRTRRVYAQEKVQIQSWKIYEGQTFSVTKIQDGNCSVYVAYSYVRSNAVSITTGQGCK